MVSFRVRSLALVAGLAVAAAAGAAWAQDKRLVVVNDNGRTMVGFYVNNQQVLGQAVPPGQAVMVDASLGGGGGCQRTLTAVFDDGTSKQGTANVCQVGQYPASARGIPFCPGDPRCKGVGHTN